eukprot:scaffold9315_cov72-Skeletonema_dohrnii-CCMP3373.AAC.3
MPCAVGLWCHLQLTYADVSFNQQMFASHHTFVIFRIFGVTRLAGSVCSKSFHDKKSITMGLSHRPCKSRSITRRQLVGYSSAVVSYLPKMENVKTKASVYIATTVDGYIADKDGSVDFLNQYQSSASEADGDMGFADF